MDRIRTATRRLAESGRERGASAVEYGLMVAAIAAVIVGVVFSLGNVIQDAFAHTNECLAAAPVGCPDPAN